MYSDKDLYEGKRPSGRLLQYLGTNVPKKGKKMNEQLNVAEQAEPVVLTEEQAAKFAQLAQKLEDEGEVFVQTEENVGTEPTVH
jgi:hypothetical protein